MNQIQNRIKAISYLLNQSSSLPAEVAISCPFILIYFSLILIKDISISYCLYFEVIYPCGLTTS